jgi:probable RNA-binding protein EIF1AD
MSHSRKHLTQKIVSECPIPSEKQKVVKVVELRGSNVCEVQDQEGSKFLVSFPSKFKKLIWIKRGDYLIVEPFPEKISRGKIKAQVVHVLLPEHIAFLKKQSLWPNQFAGDLKTQETKNLNDYFSVPSSSHTTLNDDNRILKDSDGTDDNDDDETLPEFARFK